MTVPRYDKFLNRANLFPIFVPFSRNLHIVSANMSFFDHLVFLLQYEKKRIVQIRCLTRRLWTNLQSKPERSRKKTMSKTSERGRDAGTGRFIPVKEAERRKDTAVVEKIKVGPTKHRK